MLIQPFFQPDIIESNINLIVIVLLINELSTQELLFVIFIHQIPVVNHYILDKPQIVVLIIREQIILPKLFSLDLIAIVPLNNIF